MKRGDRVGILLPQCPETAIAHVALYKAGAIAIPIFTLFGPEGVEFRLKDSGACGVITDDAGLANVQSIRHALPDLKHLIYVAEAGNEQYQSSKAKLDTIKGPVTHFYDITRPASPVRTPPACALLRGSYYSFSDRTVLCCAMDRISHRLTHAPRIQHSSFTRPVQRAIQKVVCTLIVFCWVIYRVSNCHTISSHSPTICSGRLQTGRGSVVSWTL